jgi:hypothetical protein
MSKKFLITRPNHDLITAYLYDFSAELVNTIKSTKDIHITDLDGAKANRENLENCLNKRNPGLVFLNGHGSRKKVCGYKDKVILDKSNINLTQEKIVYALSCDSLEGLGETAVKNGTKAYVGYKAKFMIIVDPTRAGSPSKDKNALPFKKACCKLLNALVYGLTVKKAIELTREEYRDLIRSYGTSEDDPNGDIPLIRFALAWNLEFLDMHGDPEAVFN